MEEFHRIRRLPPYVFEQVNRAKAAARNAGADIIDLGMGNPDLPAPAHVIEKLKDTLGKPRTDRYSASQGHRRAAPRAGRLLRAPLRREAQSRHPGRHHARLQGRLRQRRAGDHRAGRRHPGAGSELSDPRLRLPDGGRRVPLGAVGADADFFRTLERAIVHSIPKPLAVVVCYPSNPTAFVASLDFYKDLVPFAKKHGIFILSDLAYAEVYFDDNPPPSVLQVPGAMDVTVEFTSMSKTYSMPGWRIGFAVGNERIIAALARVKSYLDYGAFTPIQVAATAALNGPDDCIHEMRGPTSAGATCWSRASAAPAGRCRRRGRRCSPGRRSRNRSRASARRILHAAGREGRGRGLARHRLRRTRRGLCAHRAGRKRAAHPPGRAQHPAVP